METLTQAIVAALTDSLKNDGRLTPSNPAIVRAGEGFYYGSALHGHAGMVWDLQEGLGPWTPENGDDIESLAAEVEAMVNEAKNQE